MKRKDKSQMYRVRLFGCNHSVICQWEKNLFQKKRFSWSKILPCGFEQEGIKNGKLTAQKSSSYGVLGQTRSYLYRLKRSMALYEKASTRSNSVICYSGSSFHALELKPAQNSDTGGLYQKVKMSSGKAGWLYFLSYSSYDIGYLENVPGWG